MRTNNEVLAAIEDEARIEAAYFEPDFETIEMALEVDLDRIDDELRRAA